MILVWVLESARERIHRALSLSTSNKTLDGVSKMNEKFKCAIWSDAMMQSGRTKTVVPMTFLPIGLRGIAVTMIT